jgi:RimJ/RimL family protein N-acetyltransferase
MSFNLQPFLENEMVKLRPLMHADLESLYQVACDPLIWQQHPCSNRYKRNVFEVFFQESMDSQGALIVIDRMSNQIIGSSRYKRIPGVDPAIEIGWSFLARKYWGGKYNRAIKKLMIDYAFQHIEDIIFYVGKDNLRSRRAVEKIGGVIITNQKFGKLIRQSELELTYRINKNDLSPW